MRRALLIFLSLVLALVGWSVVCADDGFYVIPTTKQKYAPVPKTGQFHLRSISPPVLGYADGDDSWWSKGVAWPNPRFTDNGNGTVTDNLTGLIWTKNAAAFSQKTWEEALFTANNLQAGYGGLTDGSKAGDWRLPNLRELQSLIDYGRYNPALPAVNPFTNVQSDAYWSSSTCADDTFGAWAVHFGNGVMGNGTKGASAYVWCVRGGP
jgi:Protein of unknown function (DUF1566)